MKIEVDLARIKLAQTCFVCISDVPKRLVWSFRGSGPAPSENREDKAWPLPLLEIDLTTPARWKEVMLLELQGLLVAPGTQTTVSDALAMVELRFSMISRSFFLMFYDVLWCLLTCHCHQETPLCCSKLLLRSFIHDCFTVDPVRSQLEPWMILAQHNIWKSSWIPFMLSRMRLTLVMWSDGCVWK